MRGPVKHAVAIRHVFFEDLGSLGDVLCQRGFRISYMDAGVDDLNNVDALGPDLLVLLGGPIGANDEHVYPYLLDEMRLLERRLHADAPTIGICLGAQLMARVLGTRIYAGAKREIGWSPVDISDAGLRSALANLSGTPVLHWHNDTFDCPEGATCLASTQITPNQAFSWRNHCLGLQFHAEAVHRGFERWLIGHTHEINSTADCGAMRLREDTWRYAAQLQLHAGKLWNSLLSGFEIAAPLSSET